MSISPASSSSRASKPFIIHDFKPNSPYHGNETANIQRHQSWARSLASDDATNIKKLHLILAMVPHIDVDNSKDRTDIWLGVEWEETVISKPRRGRKVDKQGSVGSETRRGPRTRSMTKGYRQTEEDVAIERVETRMTMRVFVEKIESRGYGNYLDPMIERSIEGVNRKVDALEEPGQQLAGVFAAFEGYYRVLD